ncbi:MAG: hypothetical protein CL758_07695 [Chloroflexi bacterium]|nr:hypothetical protein [Chloroflexota bacterium]
MKVINFGKSYMTWYGAGEMSSISRILLDGVCTFINSRDEKEEFYLIAPCRSEHTHSDGQLIVMPNYDFRGIFGSKEYKIFRKHWVSNPNYLDDPGLDTTGGRILEESGLHKTKWDDVKLDISYFNNIKELVDKQSVVDSTLNNSILVGQTELFNEKTGEKAILEYPIKTMNVIKDIPRFQVDTGPILIPNFESVTDLKVDSLDIAHIVFNVFDKGEYILRKPVKIANTNSGPLSVTDYSKLDEYMGINRLYAVI